MCGWVQRRRVLGGLIFVDLRDRTGILQLNFDAARDQELFDKAYTLRSEDCICATGIVCGRGEGAVNPDMVTGEIELAVAELQILSKSQTPPFEIAENSTVNEELRLKYRYLDLRRPDAQAPILLRSKLASIARNYFLNNDFIEIETPNLIRPRRRAHGTIWFPAEFMPVNFMRCLNLLSFINSY